MRAGLVITALVLATSAAHADRAGGQAEFRVGAQAFRASKFAVAARSFEQAYALDARPETAFSIAQANRLQYYYDKIAWRLQRAVQMYQAYLAALPAGPRAQDAIDRITEITPILEAVRARGELVPYEPPVKTQLVVGAEVDAARVTVDGRRATLWEPVDVTEGVHVVVVEAAGYEIARRKVPITEGRFLPVDVSLVAKPARLSIVTEPGARAYVDGRRFEADREIVVAPGAHFVSITRRGRQPFSRSLVLERDAHLALAAPLRATQQRKVARWVLGAGAVLAGATLGAGGWSYVARRDATRLDAARRELDATPADLARYNTRVEDVARRDRITLGLGLAAGGVAGLGLAMWWFDNDTPSTEPRLTIAPAVGSGDAGLVVGGAF